MSPAEARAKLGALAATAEVQLSGFVSSSDMEKLRAAGVDEELVRLSLEDALSACLAKSIPVAPASGPDKTATPDPCDGHGSDDQALGDLLAVIADAAPGKVTPSIALLARLDARGVWFADLELERIVERRFEAAQPTCIAPTDDEVAREENALGDFLVVGEKSTRPLRDAEKHDLAYALAAIGSSGVPVGENPDDRASVPPIADRAVLDRLTGREKQMDQALADGDVAHYVALTKENLTDLGYPGPLRRRAKEGTRWGGSDLSYGIRKAALYAEIDGELALAHDLYRRADPGGGMCGTSAGYHEKLQIAGLIRTATDCRDVAAERLFAISAPGGYGPEPLAKNGFDIVRIYRGLFATFDRSDPAKLDVRLSGSPLANEARARVAARGPEDWATRVRAIEGYADVAKGAAVDDLLDLGKSGDAEVAPVALRALGEVVETHGGDPCGRIRFGWGRGSSDDPREVRSANLECKTMIPAAKMHEIAKAIVPLATASDPSIRLEAVVALGRVADPIAIPTLKRVAGTDAHKGEGQKCGAIGDAGPTNCHDWYDVREAATEALGAIDEAAKRTASSR